MTAACHQASDPSETVCGGDADGEDVCHVRKRETMFTVGKAEMSGEKIDGKEDQNSAGQSAENGRAGRTVQRKRTVGEKIVKSLYENCGKSAADNG